VINLENFNIEINYTDGPIPFQIQKQKVNSSNKIVEISYIEPYELYEFDREKFIFYYNLHAYIFHNMVDRISSPKCNMQELHNNSKKVLKLAKSFAILNNIFQANNDTGE
jgi:hypothetical protein